RADPPGGGRLMRIFKAALLGAVVLLSGCGYNTLQQQDEAVTAAWSEVLSQYQRRADLIPNLVETVKAFAEQEQTVLLAVTAARARTGSVQRTPAVLEDGEAARGEEGAQGEPTAALRRVVAGAATSPQGASGPAARAQQKQLERTAIR